jgi:hypothetical protein
MAGKAAKNVISSLPQPRTAGSFVMMELTTVPGFSVRFLSGILENVLHEIDHRLA